MARYNVLLSPRAQRELRALSRDLRGRIDAELNAVAEAPRSSSTKKLIGVGGPLYRARVGDYRIVYEIDDDARLVKVHRIQHRREVYR